MQDDGIGMFERKHIMDILIYLRVNGGSATRMTLYRAIANNDRMPTKFMVLENAGLVVQTKDRITRAVTLTLTDKGARVSDALIELDEMIRGTGSSEGPALDCEAARRLWKDSDAMQGGSPIHTRRMTAGRCPHETSNAGISRPGRIRTDSRPIRTGTRAILSRVWSSFLTFSLTVIEGEMPL